MAIKKSKPKKDKITGSNKSKSKKLTSKKETIKSKSKKLTSKKETIKSKKKKTKKEKTRILDNLSFVLYGLMLLSTIFSTVFAWICSVPAIFLALLFFFVSKKNKTLHNNIIIAVILMCVHIFTSIIAAISMYALIGFILYPLEILIFCGIYGFLAYKVWKDEDYAPLRII